MKKKLLIGISCFNEQANLESLVLALYKQKSVQFDLLIIDDYSSDQSQNIIKKLQKIYPIKAFFNEKNQGLAYCQNKILQEGNYEYYLLLNADICPCDNEFLQKLMQNALSTKVELSSASLIPLPPRNYLQKVLSIAHQFKSQYFKLHSHGDNVYNFYGPVKLLHNKLAKKLEFPYSISEDAYCYLYAKQMGFSYALSEACVYFVLPNSLKDHFNQSLRAWGGKKYLVKSFGETANTELKLDRVLLMKVFAKYFLQYPVEITSYLILSMVSHIKLKFKSQNLHLWQHTSSTKNFL